MTTNGEREEARGPEAASFSGLGGALRRLRIHRGYKQYEMAEAAGITKAMLSAYETGKRRPSLKTLSQLLAALEADLGNLHRAMVAERYGDSMLASRRRSTSGHGSPEADRRRHEALAGEIAEPAADVYRTDIYRADVYRVLGVDHRLPRAEEKALSEMLSGFHNLLRCLVEGNPRPRQG